MANKNNVATAKNNVAKKAEAPKVFNQFVKSVENAEKSLIDVAYWYSKLSDAEMEDAKDIFKAYGWDSGKVSRVTSIGFMLCEGKNKAGNPCVDSIFGDKVKLSFTLLAEMKGKPIDAVKAMVAELPEGTKINSCPQWREMWKKYDERLSITETAKRKARSTKNGASQAENGGNSTQGNNSTGNAENSGNSASNVVNPITPNMVVKSQDSMAVALEYKQMQTLIEWSEKQGLNSKAFMELLTILDLKPVYDRFNKAVAEAEKQKAEAPKQKAKAPKQKAEAPKAEAPKAEAPKAEAPKAEALKQKASRIGK